MRAAVLLTAIFIIPLAISVILVPANTKIPPPLIVSGGTTVLYTPRQFVVDWFSSSEEYVCTDIRLNPSVTARDVSISTIGLGKVILKEVNPSATLDCKKTISGEIGMWNLGEVSEPKRVLLKIGPVNLPGTGKARKGHVIVRASNMESVKIPIQVERSPQGNFLTAATWFFGVLIPALLTALLGYLAKLALDKRGAKDQQRKDEQMQLELLIKFRQDNQSLLDDVFNQYYPTVFKQGDKVFAQKLQDYFIRIDILNELPARDAMMLRKRFNEANREEIIKELVRLLPEWSQKIRLPRP